MCLSTWQHAFESSVQGLKKYGYDMNSLESEQRTINQHQLIDGLIKFHHSL